MDFDNNSPVAHILNLDEKIIWSEKPQKKPYLLSTLIPSFISSTIACLFCYGISLFLGDFPDFGGGNFMIYLMKGWVYIVFGVIALFPLLTILGYRNLHYYYTNKRIIIQNGAWGVDFESYEYDKISDLTVDVGPIGKSYNTGNLSFLTGKKGNKGESLSSELTAISNPYVVFKNLQKTMQDIKTDFYYPNELRPDINRGYKTEYKPD